MTNDNPTIDPWDTKDPANTDNIPDDWDGNYPEDN